jgi:hypothetical protein
MFHVEHTVKQECHLWAGLPTSCSPLEMFHVKHYGETRATMADANVQRETLR